jgi:hypothetical protein
MAFRPPKKPPEFADLKAILAQSKNTLDNSVYQTIQILIDRLGQFQITTVEGIADVNNSINESNTVINIKSDKNHTFITEDFEAIALPHSRQMLAGIGIEFDDTVENIRTINSTGAGTAIGGGIHPFLLMGG